jgi:hypothetical protein
MRKEFEKGNKNEEVVKPGIVIAPVTETGDMRCPFEKELVLKI